MESSRAADWFDHGMRADMASPAISWLPRKWHYAWVIVGVCFAVAVMTAGVRSTPGVLIVPLEDEFGWSRATISFALGINLLLFGAIGPFAAAVMDRFGARRTITLALAVTAASVALTPVMSQPWQLVLLWGVVVGLSTGFVGGFLAAYIAGRWFRAREGFVVGLLTAANAAGQLVFLPTMASLVTHAGWRIMSLVLAAAVVVFLPVPALLMRNRPGDVGLRPYGDLGASRLDASPKGNPDLGCPANRCRVDGAVRRRRQSAQTTGDRRSGPALNLVDVGSRRTDTRNTITCPKRSSVSPR
jgi:MFS family permease